MQCSNFWILIIVRHFLLLVGVMSPLVSCFRMVLDDKSRRRIHHHHYSYPYPLLPPHELSLFQGPAATALFQNPFSWLFPETTKKTELKKKKDERTRLKEALLEACTSSNKDSSKSTPQQQRASVEAAMQALREYTPVQETAASPLLQTKWKLIWTTEKEINFFLDNGWSSEITQTIQGSQLQNMIPFVGGGSFGVEGKLVVPDTNGIRTEFEFTSATLTLPPSWLILGGQEWNFPPVGKGWFDTIYLDETLRVDTNSRNDILICEPAVVVDDESS